MARKRIGMRSHYAKFKRHIGTLDDYGNPTYQKAEDWTDTGPGSWPCELLGTAGGETLRGRQVTAEATHVMYGWKIPAGSVRPTDRVVVGQQTFEVVAVMDPDGRGFETRIDAKEEIR